MPPPISLLFGPILIGAFFNTMLYGVLAVQCLIYLQTYKRDNVWLKSLVFYLFVVETINSGLIIGVVYEPLILNYGQPAATTYFPVLLPSEPLMTVAASTPVQLFIAWRIIIISGQRFIPLIIASLSLVSTGGAIWLAYTVIHIREFAKKSELHWPALTWLIAAMVADVIITCALIYSLAKRKTGVVQTDDTINKIIKLTVQTGFITAVFMVLEVVCFLVVPDSTLNFVWDLALSKLYTNALLSTLNARTKFGRSNGMTTNVLFTEGSRSRDANSMHGFQLALGSGSRSLDVSSLRDESRRTAEDIEIGVMPVKEVREI